MALGSQTPRRPSRRWATLAGALRAVGNSAGTRKWLPLLTPSCLFGAGRAIPHLLPTHRDAVPVAVLMLVMLVSLNQLIVGATRAAGRALWRAGCARGSFAGDGGAGRVRGRGSPPRAAGRAASSDRLLGRERAMLEKSWYLAKVRGEERSPGKRLRLEGRGGSARESRWQRFVTIFTLLLAQREAFGSPPLAEGISYFITSRQDNLSNFAWKKSLTKSCKATIMPDETVIEFAFLLLSQLSLCWF